ESVILTATTDEGYVALLRDNAFLSRLGDRLGQASEAPRMIEEIDPRLSEWLPRSDDRIRSMALSDDGYLLVTANDEGQVALWNLDAHRHTPLTLPKMGTQSSNALAFGPVGSTLAVGYDDGSIVVWNVSTLKPMARLVSEQVTAIGSLAFDPKGSTLV